MSEDMQKSGNVDQFRAAMGECKWRYEHYGARAFVRGYEYGVLAIKNCFLVAGGGLFFVPTMVGLSENVDLGYAIYAGVAFANAVLFSLLINYVAHWNWMLHEQVWILRFDLERIQVRLSYGRAYSADPKDSVKLEADVLNTNNWINRTFLLPHIFAVIVVVSLGFGAMYLYSAFGISGEAL